MQIPRGQIAADLAALTPLTRCVRIYAVDQGLEAVPELAREFGLKVLMGAWVGRDPDANRAQLETAIRLANQYPEVVRALVVGNEVMLRRDQLESALKAMLDEARSRVSVPVTYADVWEFWLRHPSLVDSVDFLTIHILPYWEDQPVPVEQAIAHVAQVRQRMLHHYQKPVLIGETGWPSQGRQREGARPGKVEQARYVRSFIRRAHDSGWDYNLIEAINQPWKRHLEGTVGGYWGLLDVDLRPNFPLAGAVAQRASVLPYLYSALALAAACLLLALSYSRARGWRLLAPGAMGAWAGGVLWLAWEHALVAYRDAWEWMLLGLVALAGVVLVLAVSARRTSLPLPGFVQSWQQQRERLISTLRMCILFAAATGALLLLADPRYRDFPYWLYALPLPALLLLGRLTSAGLEERLCGAVIVLCGVGRWLMEPMNAQAQAWLALCVLLAGALANSNKASNAAGAEVSKQ
jgi:glucan 1,3-beta-glucosidase